MTRVHLLFSHYCKKAFKTITIKLIFTNEEIADALERISLLLEIQGVSNFRVRAFHVDHSIKADKVVGVVQAKVVGVTQTFKCFMGRVPGRIQVDNGSEFISKALDKWAYENRVGLDFSRPGKPADNPNQASYI